MAPAHWDDGSTRCFGMLLDGRAPVSSIPKPGADASLLLVFNAWSDAVEFVLPPTAADEPWIQLVDSALEAQASEAFRPGDVYTVTGRSLLVFASAGTGQPTGWLEDLAATLPG
jgi:glycogen operon protein